MGEKVSTWFVQVSLAKKRALLVLLILVQASLLIGHLLYQRGYVEDNAARILRNTAIVQSQQFDTSLNAMRYQMRFIGNAFLLNHTVTPENAQSFLKGELKRAWLDGVVVFDEDGDFLSSRALFPFERALDASTLAQASFRQRPLFNDFRRDEVTESLFYWRSNGTDKNMVGFVMFRAVRDAHGRFLGGAVGFFNGHSMNDMFRKMEVQGFDLGHDGGDAVLKHIGNALPALVRGSDIVARFGGEEFVVAMPHTTLEAAAEIAERVRMSLASQNVDFNGQTIRFTASMGLVCMTPDELEIEHGMQSALARADQALYRAKREGRNRVCVSS